MIELSRVRRYSLPYLPFALALGLILLTRGTFLLAFVISALLAHLCEPLILRLQTRGYRRAVGVGVIYLGLLLAAAPAARFGVAWLKEEAGKIVSYSEKIGKNVTGIEESYGEGGSGEAGRSRAELIKDNLAKAADRVPDLQQRLQMTKVLVMVVPLFSFVLMLAGRRLLGRLLDALPGPYVEKALDVLFLMDLSVSRYMRSVLLESLAVGLLVFAGLAWLRLDFAAWIALFALAASLLPYAGMSLAAAAAAVLSAAQRQKEVSFAFMQAEVPLASALRQDASMVLPFAWGVLAVFVAASAVRRFALRPFLSQQRAQAHPALLLLALACGWQLGGVAGLFLSAPAACAAQLAFRALWDRCEREAGLRA